MTSTRFDLRRVSRSPRETGRLNFPGPHHTRPPGTRGNERTDVHRQSKTLSQEAGRTSVSPHLRVTGTCPGEAVPSREGVAREPLIVSVYPPLRDATTGRAYGQDDCRTQATPVGVIWSA